MRAIDIIPGPGDPNEPVPQQQPTEPQPSQPSPDPHEPNQPQEVPGEPKHYPIHREIPTQPIHEGGIK